MSSIGGSMFPRFLMPEAMQKAGLLTINAWAIDGFTKIFWRDEPLSHLWPQVLVLVGIAIVLFAIVAGWRAAGNTPKVMRCGTSLRLCFRQALLRGRLTTHRSSK